MRDKYLAQKPKPIPVEVDGDTYFVMAPTYGEFAAALKLAEQHPNQGVAVTVLTCACDQDGRRVFGPEDVDQVAGLNFKLLAKLNNATESFFDFNTDPKG